ncbi:MAG: beta-eliminating lyase-related protein [Hyphomicrobiaceae bacterium]|nr:beta-eliminating lyase-related protein [Hyphomicrobiaceae bacterium]
MSQQFASDNNAGMCPEAVSALLEANAAGHVGGYGDDAWTVKAVRLVRELFETDAKVFFAGNGTAGNALALAHLLHPFDAALAHAISHIEEDEANAVGFFSAGGKLLTADTPDAKLTPEAVAALAARGRGVHAVRPRALSLTQATELGTVYKASELSALAEAARKAGLRVHMDGARFANAVAASGRAPADLSWRAGVDVLVLGGVKNGLGFGEAIVFFDTGLAEAFEWRVKQSGHLASKLRFVTAPWAGLLESGAWLRNARHANAMAKRLEAGLARLGLAPLHPVEANAVFVELSPAAQQRLHARGWRFYAFLGVTGCRLMCAWDTAPETVDRFLADAADAVYA